MKTVLLAFIIIGSCIVNVVAQGTLSPPIQWQRSLGGSAIDMAASIYPTSDDGFIVAGSVQSNDGDVNDNHGSYDYWIVKLDSLGNVIWSKTYGGSNDDIATSIQQTRDSGYIVAGYTNSNDGDVQNGPSGNNNYWILKLNKLGIIEWQRCMGGNGDDRARCVMQNSEGGYVIAGQTNSTDGDITTVHGLYDYWIVKLDASGGLVWQHSYGGSSDDDASSVYQSADSSYIVAGTSSSVNGDVFRNHGGTPDFWILKITSKGDMLWSYCFGGSGEDRAMSVIEAGDGFYYVGGQSNSHDGDATAGHNGSFDYWVIKLGQRGQFIWQQVYGGSDDDYCTSLAKHGDAAVITGFSKSIDGMIQESRGGNDYWSLQIDGQGAVQWSNSYGGTSDDRAAAIFFTHDGGYIMAGASGSVDIDVTNHRGAVDVADFWIVKAKFATPEPPPPTPSIVISLPGSVNQSLLYPNPSKGALYFMLPMSGFFRLDVWDIAGRAVFQQTITDNRVDASRLDKGVYLYKIWNQEQVLSTGKLVIE